MKTIYILTETDFINYEVNTFKYDSEVEAKKAMVDKFYVNFNEAVKANNEKGTGDITDVDACVSTGKNYMCINMFDVFVAYNIDKFEV